MDSIKNKKDMPADMETPKTLPINYNTQVLVQTEAITDIDEGAVKVQGNNYWIGHLKCYNWEMPTHFHDHYEICFFLTENITCNVGTKSYVLKSGSIAVFNDTDIHRIIVSPDVLHDRFIIQFNPKFMQEMFFAYPELTEQFTNRTSKFQNCLQLDETQKEKIILLLNKFIYCYEDKNTNSYKLKIKLILCEILLFINEIYYANQISPAVKNYAYNEQLRPIMEYIQDNLSMDLNLDNLVSKFFIGKQTLIKLFKREIGLTPNQYLIYCRIIKAREFIKQGIYIYKVCELVGYTNISSFIRTFRRLTGYTPKYYQKK
ncbi:MAG: AraC family transcriptional regulator [Oscillospiraceae bacterium]|nr:AraC family transcriptional regulator [Oscillospiraceae bacterium]